MKKLILFSFFLFALSCRETPKPISHKITHAETANHVEDIPETLPPPPCDNIIIELENPFCVYGGKCKEPKILMNFHEKSIILESPISGELQRHEFQSIEAMIKYYGDLQIVQMY